MPVNSSSIGSVVAAMLVSGSSFRGSGSDESFVDFPSGTRRVKAQPYKAFQERGFSAEPCAELRMTFSPE